MPRVASEVHVYGYGIRESRERPPDAYGANRFFANQPIARIACSYSLLEQLQYLRKSDWHPCLCLHYFPKDQQRLLWERGGTLMFGLSIAIVPSIFSTHNSTSTEATQTLLT